MSVEEKKRKHKGNSEKRHKKKHKSERRISLVQPGSTPFSEVVVKLYVHLAPMWSEKTLEGVNEQLNAFLMK